MLSLKRHHFCAREELSTKSKSKYPIYQSVKTKFSTPCHHSQTILSAAVFRQGEGDDFVGNKVKRWISKRWLQENKARFVFIPCNNCFELCLFVLLSTTFPYLFSLSVRLVYPKRLVDKRLNSTSLQILFKVCCC